MLRPTFCFKKKKLILGKKNHRKISSPPDFYLSTWGKFAPPYTSPHAAHNLLLSARSWAPLLQQRWCERVDAPITDHWRDYVLDPNKYKTVQPPPPRVGRHKLGGLQILKYFFSFNWNHYEFSRSQILTWTYCQCLESTVSARFNRSKCRLDRNLVPTQSNFR